MKDEDKLFDVSKRAIENHFKRHARSFLGEYTGFNPARPRSLRTAFKTFLSDHKVDPLFTEFWMGHQVAEQQRVYVSKSREGWRQTYREQAEPWHACMHEGTLEVDLPQLVRRFSPEEFPALVLALVTVYAMSGENVVNGLPGQPCSLHAAHRILEKVRKLE